MGGSGCEPPPPPLSPPLSQLFSIDRQMFKPVTSYTDGWKVGECLASTFYAIENNNMVDDVNEADRLLQAIDSNKQPVRKRAKRVFIEAPAETVIEVEYGSGFCIGDIPRVKKCSISQEMHFEHVECMNALKQKIADLGLHAEYSKNRPPRPVRVKYRVTGTEQGAVDKERSLNRKTSENCRNEDYTWTEHECTAMKKFLASVTCNGS